MSFVQVVPIIPQASYLAGSEDVVMTTQTPANVDNYMNRDATMKTQTYVESQSNSSMEVDESQSSVLRNGRNQDPNPSQKRDGNSNNWDGKAI
jgi:hypothetical protein